MLFLVFVQANAQVGENTALFVQYSLKLISSKFSFAEGASVDRQGNVFLQTSQMIKFGNIALMEN